MRWHLLLPIQKWVFPITFRMFGIKDYCSSTGVCGYLHKCLPFHRWYLPTFDQLVLQVFLFCGYLSLWMSVVARRNKNDWFWWQGEDAHDVCCTCIFFILVYFTMRVHVVLLHIRYKSGMLINTLLKDTHHMNGHYISSIFDLQSKSMYSSRCCHLLTGSCSVITDQSTCKIGKIVASKSPSNCIQ